MLSAKMLSVKVWCLPPTNEETYKNVYSKVVERVREIPALMNSKAYPILVLFPPDNMNYGIGEEILVEAEFHAPIENEFAIGYTLAKKLGQLFQDNYPQSYVVVKVKGFNGTATGYWPDPEI